MGLITDQRTDYNGVEVLTDQRYIPKQKLTHITTPGNTCQEKIVLHCLNFDPLLLTKNPSRENQKPVKWWVLFAHQEWDFWVYWDCLLLLLYQNICSLTKPYEQGTIDNSLSGIRIQYDMQKYERNVIFTYRFDRLCDWPTNWLRHRLTVLLTTDWLSDWLYYWRLTDWVTDYITDDWLTEWLTILLRTDWLTDWLYYWRLTTDWLSDWLYYWRLTTDWLTVLLTNDWLTVWLTNDWLSDWLYYWRLTITDDWLTDRITDDWLTDCDWRLTHWLTLLLTTDDWLTDCTTDDWLTLLLTTELLMDDRQNEWLTDFTTDDWLTNCITDEWLTDRPTNWLTVWLSDWLTDWLCDWLTDDEWFNDDWQTAWSPGFFNSWLTDWLNDRLTAWLTEKGYWLNTNDWQRNYLPWIEISGAQFIWSCVVIYLPSLL